MKKDFLISSDSNDNSKDYNSYDKKNIYFDLLKHKDGLIEYEKKLKDFYNKINISLAHK